MEVKQWLDVLFGPGDDSHPFWLTAVRLNILLFLSCAILVAAAAVARRSKRRLDWFEAAIIFALTVVAGLLRFVVASPNLMDFGGIPYSRLLFGYKGYFATAQFYSLFYELTARDIEQAILFDRIAGTLTVPAVYFLCRRLVEGSTLFPTIAAFLFAMYPAHILFSASDTLSIFSALLAATSYLLVAGAVDEDRGWLAEVRYLGGFTGLILLTQVRYENVLLLVPPALFLLWHRKTLSRPLLLRALLVTAPFALFYAFEATTTGLSFRNPVYLERGLDLTIHHLILNPFFALPVLFVGSLVLPLFGRFVAGALVLLAWAAALAMCVGAAEDGHGTARIFTNWLILLLPAAAYGFSLLGESRFRLLRAIGFVAIIGLGSLPLFAQHRLSAQYLEILENDRFRSLLDDLPHEIERVIVPDDEIMWRRHHSTLEVYRKYQAILWEHPRFPELELIPVTRYLELPAAERCQPGTCFFFAGLPCMDGVMFPETRAQCIQLLREHPTSIVEDETVVAGPFVSCSIYVGSLARELCEPATAPRRFVTYQVDG